MDKKEKNILLVRVAGSIIGFVLTVFGICFWIKFMSDASTPMEQLIKLIVSAVCIGLGFYIVHLSHKYEDEKRKKVEKETKPKLKS